MAAKQKKDLYSQRTMVDVTMSAANTVTFKKIDFAVGLFQGIAIKLHRVEMHPVAATISELVAGTDKLSMALTTRNSLSALDPVDLSVTYIDSLDCVGANVEPIRIPLIQDFSTLPQGGMLVLANPMYAAVMTAGFANPAQVRFVLHYSFIELTDAESRELLQTLLPGNV